MGEHSKSPTAKPVAKVTAATAAGAAFYLATYIAGRFGYEVDPELEDALAVLVVFAGGYLKRP
jgi:hypothetical protein